VLAPFLDHGEWFVGRDILFLLSMSQEPEAATLIMQSCAHPHPRLRQQAISMLGHFPPGPADVFVVSALEDKDAGVRQAAVQVAGQRKTPAAAETLRVVVTRPDFESRELNEIRTYLMAYALLAADAAVTTLDRILNPPLMQKGTALLNRLKNSVDAAADAQKVDLRIAAAAALGAIDSAGASLSLQKGARSLIPPVRNACLKALNKGAAPLEKKG
jgi:HEAT repeat protein